MPTGSPNSLLALLLGLFALACVPATPASHPSIVLVVLDTTRADAISAYGSVEGTTPTVDRLAAEGLLYQRAYAHSPWTLPSHITMFTGLLPSQHGTHSLNTIAHDDLVTLAEHFERAGYETIAFSENPWLSDSPSQGFGLVTSIDHTQHDDLPRRIAKWLGERKQEKPFFLFVNIMNAHAPLHVRKSNERLPGSLSPEAAHSFDQHLEQLCANAEMQKDWAETYRALYHDGVAKADSKLAEILESLGESDLVEPLITIVTSDHGEAFGAHQLIHHYFSLYQDLLHVPLIVHGLRDVKPGVVWSPVGLVDLAPSILEWAGLPVPGDLSGQPLPKTTIAANTKRTLIAEFYDPREQPVPTNALLRQLIASAESGCTPEQLVPGHIRSVTQYPYKLIRADDGKTLLFDLRDDPGELQDLSSVTPKIATTLARQLDLSRSATHEFGEPADGSISQETIERLRALGYTGTDQQLE